MTFLRGTACPFQQRPTTLHSLGGLVTQRLLLTHRELIPKVKFIYFFSTPDEGAINGKAGPASTRLIVRQGLPRGHHRGWRWISLYNLAPHSESSQANREYTLISKYETIDSGWHVGRRIGSVDADRADRACVMRGILAANITQPRWQLRNLRNCCADGWDAAGLIAKIAVSE